MGLIGRLKQPCASCGFEAPHVRQNDGKHPTIYCPECGLTTPGRTGKQAAGILANMRREGAGHELERRSDDIVVPAPAPAPSPADAKPATASSLRKAGRGAFQTILDTVKK